jgi:hypothetical protein
VAIATAAAAGFLSSIIGFAVLGLPWVKVKAEQRLTVASRARASNLDPAFSDDGHRRYSVKWCPTQA